MTLILPRTGLAKNFITGAQENVGIRVPSHPLAQSLLQEFEALGGFGVAAPSANRFGKVSPTTAEAVQEELSPYLSPDDSILDGGYCQIGIESTIIDCTHELPQILRPGGITQEQIESIIELNSNPKNNNRINKIKVPGLLDSHYCPKAKVLLSGRPQPGDGFIALANVQSPLGSIRLASPKDNEEFARQLYGALRLADHKNIEKIFVVTAEGNGIAIAINERLEKASMPSKNII
jgi:L-threonylcarbamoyladenylate synthase